MTEKSLGEIIKTARKSKGLTQKDLAEIVGVANATIQKYEKGIIKNIPLETLFAFSAHLDIPPQELGIKPLPKENLYEKLADILPRLFDDAGDPATISVGQYFIIDLTLTKFTKDDISQIYGTVMRMALLSELNKRQKEIQSPPTKITVKAKK